MLEETIISIARTIYYKDGSGWKVDRDGGWSANTIQAVSEDMPVGLTDVISSVAEAWESSR